MRVMQLTAAIIDSLAVRKAMLLRCPGAWGSATLFIVVTIQPGGLPEEETIDGVRVTAPKLEPESDPLLFGTPRIPFIHLRPTRRGCRSAPNNSARTASAEHSTTGLITLSSRSTTRIRDPPTRAHCTITGWHARKTLLRSGHGAVLWTGNLRCLCAPEQYGLLKGSMITMTMARQSVPPASR